MNDQLVAYIKRQSAQQELRDDIVKELLDVGWNKGDIDTAFTVVENLASQVSLVKQKDLKESSQSSSISDVSDTATNKTYSDQHSMPVVEASVSTVTNEKDNTSVSLGQTLPGIFALLRGGFTIYKDRFGVLLEINTLWLLIYLLIGLSMFVFGTVLSTPTSFVHSASPAVLIAASLLIIVLGIGMTWLWYWITLASLEAIRGYKENISFKQSFGNTRHRVWSFLWFVIVATLVIIGSIYIFTLLPAYIFYAVLNFLTIFLPFGLILRLFFIISSVILVPLFGIWFIFSGWVFLTDSQRGIRALTASRELVRGRFWEVFWRIFVVVIVTGIGIVLFRLMLIIIFSSVLKVADIIFVIVNILFSVPFVFAVTYFLYEHIRLQVPHIPVSTSHIRKVFISYALVGSVMSFLIFVILPILFGALNIALNTARLKEGDVILMNDLSKISIQAGVDYSGNNNSYGSMKSVAKVPTTAFNWNGETGAAGVSVFSSLVTATNADRDVARELQRLSKIENIYRNNYNADVYYFANKNSFFVVAKLLSKKAYWCVDSSGYSGAIKQVPIAGNLCK